MPLRTLSRIAYLLLTLLLTSTFQPSAAVTSAAQAGCSTFRETGKSVCGTFLQYWQQHGGVMQQGYPVSDEFTEISALDGKPYAVQYFERAVFEYHPENDVANRVLLSQLGTFKYKSR